MAVEVSELWSASPSITQLMRERPYDVLLLKLSMPELDDIEILAMLKNRESLLQNLDLSNHGTEQLAVRTRQAGAVACLTKEEAPDELIEAVRVVARGRKYITAGMDESLDNHVVDDSDLMPHQVLSDREFQTVRMLASGHTRAAIAQALSISTKTVNIYRSRALEKMGMQNNAQLAHYIVNHGLRD